jgi:hypothetical protein
MGREKILVPCPLPLVPFTGLVLPVGLKPFALLP